MINKGLWPGLLKGLEITWPYFLLAFLIAFLVSIFNRHLKKKKKHK